MEDGQSACKLTRRRKIENTSLSLGVLRRMARRDGEGVRVLNFGGYKSVDMCVSHLVTQQGWMLEARAPLVCDMVNRAAPRPPRFRSAPAVLQGRDPEQRALKLLELPTSQTATNQLANKAATAAASR